MCDGWLDRARRALSKTTKSISGKQWTDSRAENRPQPRVSDKPMLFPRFTPPRAGPRLGASQFVNKAVVKMRERISRELLGLLFAKYIQNDRIHPIMNRSDSPSIPRRFPARAVLSAHSGRYSADSDKARHGSQSLDIMSLALC